LNLAKGSIKPQELLLLLESVTIYRQVLKRQPILTLHQFLQELSKPDRDFVRINGLYHELCALLSSTGWKTAILNLILTDENDFTHTIAQDTALSKWEKIVQRDLKLLGIIASLSAKDLKQMAGHILNEEFNNSVSTYRDVLSISEWPEWPTDHDPFSTQTPKSKSLAWLNEERTKLTSCFFSLPSWEMGLEALIHYYRVVGTGTFSGYTAFRWVSETNSLEGIDRPDAILLSDLIGQAREQKIVLENTEHFLCGYPANNVILYGDRGTGKSSLVKALLNEYAPRGLRLVELRKADLGDYLKVINILKDKPLKFIIFIDDLSFTDNEPEFKTLKTLLEGGIEARPANVLIYATSNRRHLIKESFADRQGDDVHFRDNQEEILSLADRFGITVTFPAPDQEGYLQIVEGLARQHGIAIEPDLLRQQALRWSMFHNGYSGRTARQFIDHLIAVEASKK